jgi:hypothetical protein
MGNLLTADEERVQVETIKVQMERAMAKSDRVVIAGDFNLDTHKKGRKGGAMVEAFLNDTAVLGYTYTLTVEMWVSYSVHGIYRTNHCGCLDHVSGRASKTYLSLSLWSTTGPQITALFLLSSTAPGLRTAAA